MMTSTTRFFYLFGCWLLIGFFAVCANLCASTVTGWDFEDNTLQGWTNVLTSTTGPMEYKAMVESEGVSGSTWDPLGYDSTLNPNVHMAGVIRILSNNSAFIDFC